MDSLAVQLSLVLLSFVTQIFYRKSLTMLELGLHLDIFVSYQLSCLSKRIKLFKSGIFSLMGEICLFIH